MTRQLISTNGQPLLRPSHAKRPPQSGFVQVGLPEKFRLVPVASDHSKLKAMKPVVILGRGASGKATLARRLGNITGLPVIELDKIFWQAGLIATPREKWALVQETIVAEDRWIIEGDLGNHDAFEVRLRTADTIILLDFSLLRCVLQAIRRSRERSDFWFWLIAYRYRSLPILREAISKYAQKATFHLFRDRRAMDRFVEDVVISRQHGKLVSNHNPDQLKS